MCTVFSFVKCMKKCDKSKIYTGVVVFMNSNKVEEEDILSVPQKQPDYVHHHVGQPAKVESVGQQTLSPGSNHKETNKRIMLIIRTCNDLHTFARVFLVFCEYFARTLPSEHVCSEIYDHQGEPCVDNTPDGEGPASWSDASLIASRHITCAGAEWTWKTEQRCSRTAYRPDMP